MQNYHTFGQTTILIIFLKVWTSFIICFLNLNLAPPLHHTTPREKKKKSSPIHTVQPQRKSFRGTLKIHLLSSVPPSNTQYQIQHICKSDTKECISIRTGGEIKSPFPFQRFHRQKRFPLILKYCHTYNRIHTLFLNCILKFWVNTGAGVGCCCVADNFILYKSEPGQVFQRYWKLCWTSKLNVGRLCFAWSVVCSNRKGSLFSSNY